MMAALCSMYFKGKYDYQTKGRRHIREKSGQARGTGKPRVIVPGPRVGAARDKKKIVVIPLWNSEIAKI